jgi:cytochrome c-type biogenesis protein CcmH
MLLGFVLFLVLAGAITALLWPLAYPSHKISPTDRELFLKQLAELERDRQRGILHDEDHEQAKIEMAQRFLRSPNRISVSSSEKNRLSRRRKATVLIWILVPVISGGFYLYHGSPNRPAQPLAVRLQEQAPLFQAIAAVEARLKTHPDDGKGWEVIAPVYMRVGRIAEAVQAWQNALALLGETPERLIAYADARLAEDRGKISILTAQVLERILVLDPAFAKARFHLAQFHEQEGRRSEARQAYERLLSEVPEDTPWLLLVRERLKRLSS